MPRSYQAFLKLFSSMGTPRRPVPAPTSSQLGAASDSDSVPVTPVHPESSTDEFSIPTLLELGYTEAPTSSFLGGETKALARMESQVTRRPAWVAAFEKPSTKPNSLEPSTTGLGPYLAMGALSACTFYHAISAACAGRKVSAPPVSLHAQLLWREFFYLCSVTTPNFHLMEGNPLCRQIPWDRNPALVELWATASTGYPFIDAAMTQLRVDGWIHHLARHAVACFLTRGDLWQHWEDGASVFERYLLDGDYAINVANWQWLSCSRFFYQYFRCYSPIAFGKKTDPEGAYIRKWLPCLARMPTKYIYEPWTAPLAVQKAAGCVVGVDYPSPIVNHAAASKENMSRMARAYGAARGGDAAAAADAGEEGEAAVVGSEAFKLVTTGTLARKRSRE